MKTREGHATAVQRVWATLYREAVKCNLCFCGRVLPGVTGGDGETFCRDLKKNLAKRKKHVHNIYYFGALAQLVEQRTLNP